MGLLSFEEKGNKQASKESKNSANYHEGYESAEVLMITEASCTEEWILDSGCTFHMTPCRSYFSDISEFEGGKVIMGNNQKCTVKGIGTVSLKLTDGSCKVLHSVRYVPDLKRNLISLGTLDRAGYRYTSENGTLKVMKDDVLKLSGKLQNGLYVLQGRTIVGESHVSDLASKETTLWHKRLAHIDGKGLEYLYKQGLIGNKRPVDLAFYEHCVLGKSTRASFPYD